MRNEGILKYLTITTVIVVILMIVNIFALHAVRRQYAPATSAGASLFNISGQVREWFGYIKQWKDLATENTKLQNTESQYLSLEATVQSLQTQNDTLKKTLNLDNKFKRHLLPAGIFNISLSATGYHALINKGTIDNVTIGQTIVSLTGELIGKVSAVFSATAEVTLLTDPTFSATAHVLNGQTSGIIHGALTEGMTLDLVTQADVITEGDTIVTAGDDTIPAGLIIGTVRNVQNNDTQLFKKVMVNPAIELTSGSVAVVQ